MKVADFFEDRYRWFLIWVELCNTFDKSASSAIQISRKVMENSLRMRTDSHKFKFDYVCRKILIPVSQIEKILEVHDIQGMRPIGVNMLCDLLWLARLYIKDWQQIIALR